MNAELIKALRRCSYTTVAGADREDGYCKPCAYYAEDSADVTCIDRMMIDAADALEAAEKRIDGLLKLVDINTERCEAVRKQLREAHESYEKHIAELEAQIPKRGEWIDGDARQVTARCSVCGHLRLGNGAEWANKYVRFCENCGARMRKGAENER